MFWKVFVLKLSGKFFLPVQPTTFASELGNVDRVGSPFLVCWSSFSKVYEHGSRWCSKESWARFLLILVILFVHWVWTCFQFAFYEVLHLFCNFICRSWIVCKVSCVTLMCIYSGGVIMFDGRLMDETTDLFRLLPKRGITTLSRQPFMSILHDKSATLVNTIEV